MSRSISNAVGDNCSLRCHVDRDTRTHEKPWQDLRGQQKSIGRQTCALFACQPAEQAYQRRLPGVKPHESIRARQFSHFLRLGLETGQADLNCDGQINQEEIHHYIESKLNETFNNSRPIAADQQHPSLDSTHPKTTIFFKARDRS